MCEVLTFWTFGKINQETHSGAYRLNGLEGCMQTKNCFLWIAGFALSSVLLAMPLFSQSYTLQGRVYAGDTGVEPPTSTPISNVTVTLWGANDSGIKLSPSIDNTTTDGSGFYALDVNPMDDAYDFYIIEETDKSGYYSVGATTVGGSKLTNNRIEYTYMQLVSGDRTGNKFWDKPSTAPIIEVRGRSQKIPDGDTTPTTADGTDFGLVTLGVEDTQSFYIRNTGSAVLNLSGVTLTGSGDFSIPHMPASTVAVGDHTSFYVRFVPTAAGVRSATVNITNNTSISPYDFMIKGEGEGQPTPVPDIDVRCRGISIPDGDVTPSTADGTDRGLVNLGVADTQSFYVRNTGAAVLNLSGVTLSGSGDFSIPNMPASTVAVGDHTKFVVRFVPTDAGVRSATVNIGNNTTAKNPYDFVIQGTGQGQPTPVPDIDVQGYGISIPDGDVTPSTADGTDFGLAYLGGVDSMIFMVQNTGTAALNLSGVTLSGSGDFSVHHMMPSSVAVGDKTSFKIRFVPTAVGMRSATVNIGNNTTAKNPYDFMIQGMVAGSPQDMGSIFIGKVANHPNTPFYFIGDLGAFSLYNPVDSSIDFSGIPPGSYNITELAQPGWNLDNIQINDPSGGSTADVSTATAHINVDGNERINIYFYNTKGGEQILDFGDAPDPSYPTLLANNGARHVIKQGFFLGTGIDDETTGQPSVWADGDDTHNVNDEDGVLMSPFIGIGQSVPIKINASAAGFVNAWIDFNANGSWGEAGEQILSAIPVNAGSNFFTINVPSGLKEGPIYARFRFSSVAQLSYIGSAPDGEVEDYVIELKSEQNGSIKVIKEATPEDNTTFWMCAAMQNAFFNLYCFPLHDPSDNSFIFLNPGDISEISESSVPGWTLDGINITGDTDNGSTVNLAAGTVMLDFDTGENIVITFINHKDEDVPPPPVKWPQIPKKKGDSDHPDCFWGWDEPSVYSQVIAADDWYSGDERPVTDIHWWGSYQDWLQETPPVKAPEQFHISIWTDVPGGVDKPWSHPGTLVWETMVNRNELNERCVGCDFYPPKMQEPEACFRYDFLLPPASWFHPQSNTVYWISIDAMYQSLPDQFPWGWKTVTHYFQDDAVRITAPSAPVISDVFQMGQPIGEGWDLAFMLTSDQPSEDYDFGDAPDSHNSPGYPTLHANGGAYHTVNPGFCLGAGIDTDVNGQPNSNAMGDDNDGNDDEDGVQFPPTMQAGQMVSIPVTASDKGILNVWIDYNKNQDWSEPGEHIFIDEPLNSGLNNLNFTVPADALTGETFARFRLSRDPGVSFMGWGKEGEVEDYVVDITNQSTKPDTGIGAVKWSQPPLFDLMSEDTTGYIGWLESSAFLKSFVGDDWFCHDPCPVTCIRWWGGYADWDSQSPPDEAPPYFHIGIWTDVSRNPDNPFSHPGTMIREWFVDRLQTDETNDKSYRHPEMMEKTCTAFKYTFAMPEDTWFYQEGDSTVYWLTVEAVYDEIPEMNRWGWLTREHYFNDDMIRIFQPAGPHPDADFEAGEPLARRWDLAFELGTLEYESDYDFGDAPDIGYGSTLVKNGAHHLILTGFYLGQSIDAEPDGQPGSEASGDDENGFSDEDGIQFINTLLPGEMADIEVTASAAGLLNGWIDFNGDRSWSQPEEQVLTDALIMPGTHIVKFPVAETAQNGETYARFRFSTRPGVWYSGFAVNGEVEDYRINIGPAASIGPSPDIPLKYALYQNYPNPFNPRTSIGFDIPATDGQRVSVRIDIYNLQGQRIRTLIHDERSPGHYQVHWNGLDDAGNPMPAGIYLLRMKAGEFIQTKKLLLQK
jgi:hypothetical protein